MATSALVVGIEGRARAQAAPETTPEAAPETAPEAASEAAPEAAPQTAPEAAPQTAPAEPMRTQGVFVNPLGLVSGVLGAEYGVALSERAALAITPAFAYANLPDLSAIGAELAVGVQFYPAKRVFESVYLYPFVNAGYLSLTGSGESAAIQLVGGGAIAGYQWTWSGGFSLRLGAGAAYTFVTATDGEASASLAGVGPRLEGILGYAW